MTDIEKTAKDDGVTVHNQNVELVFFTVTKAAQNDTLTITDAKKIYWAHACVLDSSNDLSEDTVTIDYSNDPGEIKLTSATTGTAYVMVVMERE